jgi:hypothetical protein
MDRDVLAPSPDAVPPVRWETARKVLLLGAGLTAVAAGLGLVATVVDNTPWWVSTVRLLLVLGGVVTTGFGMSLRPELGRSWGIGGLVALLGWAGTPAHWDSFRLLFLILATIAFARGVVVILPTVWHIRVVSAFIIFHFFGIFMATTSPHPTPWLTEQLYHRLYNQYLQFTYLRNAYHFYSPAPGPASVMCCLIKTELPGETEVTADGQVRKKYDRHWVVLPRRPADVRDPLGLTYYRRLCLTDQISRRASERFSASTFEKNEVFNRRKNRSQTPPAIPFHPSESEDVQYWLPTPEVARYLLPSYAKHLILEETPNSETAARTTLKFYRVEHRTLGVQEFVGFGYPGWRPGDPHRPGNPYHAVTFRPYYMGEFDATGQLRDPQNDMLYWLLPILPRETAAFVPGEQGKDYVDYMSIHAEFPFDWSQLR